MTIDREKLAQRLMATFLDELDEHVRALDRDALAFEKAAEAERVELTKHLFRTMHSLKGAARSVGLDVIATACHEFEEILARARDDKAPLGADQIQLLFVAADALRDAAERLRDQRGLTDSPIVALLARLDERPRGRLPAPLPTPAPPARPAPPAPAEPVATPAVPTRDTVRVAAEKLDRLMTYSGEMLIARRRLGARREDAQDLRKAAGTLRDEAQRLDKLLRKQAPRAVALALERVREATRLIDRGMDRLASNLRVDHYLLEQSAAALDDELRRSRMLPFSEVAEGLERAVRDAARAAGKEVELAVVGATVEIDRSVLSQLSDPLLHLVRNAVDHGIEAPAARAQAGKPRAGRIVLGVELKGTGIAVTVEDDGRGIDLPAVREQARRRGIVPPEDPGAAARLVFLPGLSTSRLVTELSGRGVGLDIVKHHVERLHGSIDLSSTPRGTRFVVLLPITLTTIRVLLARAGGRTYALPSTNLLRLARVSLASLGSIEGRPVLLGAGSPIPVVDLADVLGVGRALRSAADKVSIVVVEVGERRLALIVDELVAEQEVVAKGMGARLRRVRHFTGATVLATGEIALIVSMPDVIATGLSVRAAPIITTTAAAQEVVKRLLVADDSVTTRTLEKTILEAAGYEVIAASDGAEAWHLLQERGADLVISDVEMPRMDGFMLAAAIRGSKRFAELPIILLTALASEGDRARGLAVGADAYLVKSAFDQTNLLETVAQLL